MTVAILVACIIILAPVLYWIAALLMVAVLSACIAALLTVVAMVDRSSAWRRRP